MAFSFAFFVYVVSTPVETLETMCETWRRHTEATEAMTTTEAHRHRGDHDRGDHHTEAVETLEAVEVKRHHTEATSTTTTEEATEAETFCVNQRRPRPRRPPHQYKGGRGTGEGTRRHQCHHRGHHHHRHQ